MPRYDTDDIVASIDALREEVAALRRPVAWEYVITPDLSTEHLQELGADGWELVAVIPKDWATKEGASWVAPTGYFKRPLREG